MDDAVSVLPIRDELRGFTCSEGDDGVGRCAMSFRYLDVSLASWLQ